ncbi:MAG: methylated-DNA--[protein]-cysteine S-methyltransferase [Gammaproteobacteria bacterium]|nr:methylated-DNA--[protein]-cysteine S-methyltransferase [Gammaproteobacteria bacterium]MDH5592995.1 methylated-DNA--[protein]-cysteine S-methyltransferase [Gammaproteobacteria bacterium]MDH5614260.1 methylated-DNA--[protein]-cysteine S-methyltransferase [Gammaproteobacteria bacterium]
MQKSDPENYAIVMTTPIDGFDGKLGVVIENGAVNAIDFLSPEVVTKPAKDPFSKKVEQELLAYFENPAFEFSISVSLQGTVFRSRVWSLLKKIPIGETRSYGEVAQELKSSARAVGGACRDNPVPFIIPCHRVIAQTGIGGYSGETDGWKMNIKRWLLAHESNPKMHS